MRITLGPSVVRGNIDELITGLWSFANALGLKTDDINERTAAEGVTVDGLLIKDAGIPEAAVTAHEAALAILETQIADGTIFGRLADAETVAGVWTFTDEILALGRVNVANMALATTIAYLTGVTGDAASRFSVQADGTMEWGDGTGAKDTNLFRGAADQLRTSDDFRVDGAMILVGSVDLSPRDMTLSGGATDHDVPTGTVTVQRLDPNGTTAIGGFANPRAERIIIVLNTTANSVTVTHENSGSVAANRIICPNASSFNITGSDGVLFWYDGATARWRTMGLNP